MLESAFSAAKLLLSAVPVLTHPIPGAAVSLALDASDSHMVAVLQQKLHGSYLVFQALTSRVDVFLMCIWIWWNPCLPARDLVIF